MNPVIVLDVNYLCWRAYHTTGKMNLSFGGAATGVLFGFFRGLKVLTDQFASDQFAFCFDHGHNIRKDVFPGYKAGRANKILTPEEKAGIGQMRVQLEALKDSLLHEIGFRNVFFEEGYEADDLIASIAVNRKKGTELVIVSGDRDLFQVLDPDVCLWDPVKKQATTDGMFSSRYGISPADWPSAKAIAGCKTDDIPGCRGAGDVTAARFLAHRMPKAGKTYANIVRWIAGPQFQTNLRLTALPFEGCPKIKLVHQPPLDPKKWDRVVVGKFGMNNLKGAVPSYAGFGLRRG